MVMQNLGGGGGGGAGRGVNRVHYGLCENGESVKSVYPGLKFFVRIRLCTSPIINLVCSL